MKQRKETFAMGVITVLLAISLVVVVAVSRSDLQEKQGTIAGLESQNQQLSSSIMDQEEQLAHQGNLIEELDYSNNDLTYRLSTVKAKRAEEQAAFQELQEQNRLLSQKIEKLSNESKQAEQSVKAPTAPKPVKTEPVKVEAPKANPKPAAPQPAPNAGSNYMNFEATYYDLGWASTGKRPGDKAYGITRSGRPVEAGVTIAVDPTVIPLGSWVEIVHADGRVEKRRADDTGSAIKGHILDLYVPNAKGYGRDHVKVRILSTPGK